jgi:hypothetical protein
MLEVNAKSRFAVNVSDYDFDETLLIRKYLTLLAGLFDLSNSICRALEPTFSLGLSIDTSLVVC